MKETDSSTTCNKCDGPNHLARDCLLQHKPIPALCYKCKKQGYSLWVSGKRIRGWNFGASFSPKTSVNMALPTVSVHINGKKHTALVDAGCTQTLVHKLCCQMWERKEAPMITVGESSLICYGESVVWIGIGNRPPVVVRTLVLDKELLGYDQLLWLDAIIQLGGIALSGTGEVKFPQHGIPICAAITLNEPDFHAEYNRGKHVWTASWKWSVD